VLYILSIEGYPADCALNTAFTSNLPKIGKRDGIDEGGEMDTLMDRVDSGDCWLSMRTEGGSIT